MLRQAPAAHVPSDDQEHAQRRSLAEAAREGSPHAWNELYVQVYPRLRAYVARRCGHDVAEDLVSETMTRAVGAIKRFQWESDAGFDGWLFGIARHVTADHGRRLSRARRRSGLVDPIDSAGELPGERLELIDEHTDLRRAFAQMSAADQELLELRVIAGLSADEVAAILGKQSGAIRMAQSRALGRLRTMLEGPS